MWNETETIETENITISLYRLCSIYKTSNTILHNYIWEIQTGTRLIDIEIEPITNDLSIGLIYEDSNPIIIDNLKIDNIKNFTLLENLNSFNTDNVLEDISNYTTNNQFQSSALQNTSNLEELNFHVDLGIGKYISILPNYKVKNRIPNLKKNITYNIDLYL